jgi:hypothetical protein
VRRARTSRQDTQHGEEQSPPQCQPRLGVQLRARPSLHKRAQMTTPWEHEAASGPSAAQGCTKDGDSDPMAAPGPSRTCASGEAGGLGVRNLCWREETEALAAAAAAAAAASAAAATSREPRAASREPRAASRQPPAVTECEIVSSRYHKLHAPSRVASPDAQVREGPGAAMGNAWSSLVHECAALGPDAAP